MDPELVAALTTGTDDDIYVSTRRFYIKQSPYFTFNNDRQIQPRTSRHPPTDMDDLGRLLEQTDDDPAAVVSAVYIIVMLSPAISAEHTMLFVNFAERFIAANDPNPVQSKAICSNLIKGSPVSSLTAFNVDETSPLRDMIVNDVIARLFSYFD